LEWDRPGPFDNPERLLASDRCVASFRSAVPSLPSVYNNLQQIVQTDDYVMILNEMIHDARIVRLAGDGRRSEHAPPELKFWLGDSIGWWEGDTLVVETTHFGSRAYLFLSGPDGPQGGTNWHLSGAQRVVERFTRVGPDTLDYEFTVNDPGAYTSEWGGEVPMKALDGLIYEYACHEGNYALGNILRGARYEESLEAEEAARR